MSVLTPREILLGEPVDPAHQPDPVLLADFLEYLEGLTGGALAYYVDDLADLSGLSAASGQAAMVLTDANAANRGVYSYNGSTWSKTADLPAGYASNAALDGRVSTAESDILTLEGDVSGLQASFAGLGSAAQAETADFATAAQGQLADETAAVVLSGYSLDALEVFVDAQGQIYGSVGSDAAWDILLARIATADGLSVEDYQQTGAVRLVFTDADGNVIFDSGAAPAELRTEAGLSLAPYQRTAATDDLILTDQAGNILAELSSDVPAALGQGRLRRLNLALAQLALGASAQVDIAAIGDSFTQNHLRWSGPYAEAIIARHGDGGGGWTGYGYWAAYSGPYASGGAQPGGQNGNARPALYTVVYDGAWDRLHNGSVSPDLDHVFSSTPGDRITRTVPAAPDHTALRLVYVETADGVIRHRVDGGAWTSVNTQGTVGAIGTADIALTGGAHTVEIEVVSGTVNLCGDNALSAAPGVRFHKLGASGSRVAQWTGVDATQQIAGWAALEIETFLIMDGTNSQGAGQSVDNWQVTMETLIRRARQATPGADIGILMPPENLRTDNAFPMRAYARRGAHLARTLQTAFLDLQPAFGDVPADYASDGPVPLFNADNVHPEPDTGGRMIVQALAEFTFPKLV